MKKISIIFVLGIFLVGSFSQAKAQFIKNKIDSIRHKRQIRISETDKYLLSGISLVFSDVQDSKMTPFVYSGPGIGYFGGKYKTRKRFTTFYNFDANYVALLGPQQLSSYMHGIKLRLNGGKLYQLKNPAWKMGASSNLESYTRIYMKNGNDALNEEMLATLNFATSYSFDFNLCKRKNTFDIRAELPLVAYAFRYPDFSVFNTNEQFMPIGKYNSLRTKFTLIRPMKHSQENLYSISYEWDFYTFTEKDQLFKLVAGTHFLTFTYWLKKM